MNFNLRSTAMQFSVSPLILPLWVLVLAPALSQAQEVELQGTIKSVGSNNVTVAVESASDPAFAPGSSAVIYADEHTMVVRNYNTAKLADFKTGEPVSLRFVHDKNSASFDFANQIRLNVPPPTPVTIPPKQP